MSTQNWINRQTGHAARLDNRPRVVAVTSSIGTGLECAYCHKPIAPDTVDYEVEALVLGRLRTLHFHRLCQHLWDASAS
jgi:hypothetical protein